jgi:transposase
MRKIKRDAFDAFPEKQKIKATVSSFNNTFFAELPKHSIEALPKHIDRPDSILPATAIKNINHLFEIENKLKILSPKGRKEQRLIQEKPVLDVFWSGIEESATKVLPSSQLGKAFS